MQKIATSFFLVVSNIKLRKFSLVSAAAEAVGWMYVVNMTDNVIHRLTIFAWLVESCKIFSCFEVIKKQIIVCSIRTHQPSYMWDSLKPFFKAQLLAFLLKLFYSSRRRCLGEPRFERKTSHRLESRWKHLLRLNFLGRSQSSPVKRCVYST